MKKIKLVFTVLIISLLFLTVSCEAQKDSLCYYGLFSDSAVMISYNAKHNTVYDITLPYDAIINWGVINGIENIPNAIRSFTGAKENGFIMGSKDTFESLCMINKASMQDLSSLSNNAILNNINQLGSADLTMLISSIDGETVFEQINALNYEGSQEHFAAWVKQIYGE